MITSSLQPLCTWNSETISSLGAFIHCFKSHWDYFTVSAGPLEKNIKHQIFSVIKAATPNKYPLEMQYVTEEEGENYPINRESC